ncbi:Protein VTS1 [Kluyveromyces marxianus]
MMSSLPGRAQSPVGLPRGAHPGAVLLSPQSSSANLQSLGTNPTSPSQQPLFLNDLLDQQQFSLDSQLHLRGDMGRPSNMVSPLSNSAMNPTGSNGSTFLDSFSRPTSSMAASHQPLPLQQSNNNANVVVNFTNDVNQLCNWISMLTPAQQNTVMDNLLSSLNEEVLHNTKLKLDSLVHSGYISPTLGPIASPVPSKVQGHLHQAENPQPLNLDSVLNGDNIYRQWSPLPQHTANPLQQPMYDYLNDIPRPSSADPYTAFKKSGPTNGVVNSINMNNASNSHNGNSSGNKNNNNNNNSAASNSNNNSIGSTGMATSNSTNSHVSRKTSNQNHYLNRPQSPAAGKANAYNKPSLNTSLSNSGNALTTVNSASSTTSNSNGTNNSMNAKALCDPKLLKNIPAWLKSLRLHKYSEALGGKPWYELIYLDDEALEKMGVSALGARRKLLKAFSIVKEYKSNDMIDPSAF